MFVDQPVGTGFSYADSMSDYVTNEEMVAEDMYEFLQGFFKQNPQYNKSVFLFGESYAGHYIPAVGARIVEGNNNVTKGYVHVDFKGMAIGNGWVDPVCSYYFGSDLFSDHPIRSLCRSFEIQKSLGCRLDSYLQLRRLSCLRVTH